MKDQEKDRVILASAEKGHNLDKLVELKISSAYQNIYL